jgi:mRNA-degrading endonuclease toxin of MazEF toxin-antitoxin module
MSSAVRPSYGDIWIVELDPTRGHKQGGTRPAVVISTCAANTIELRGPATSGGVPTMANMADGDMIGTAPVDMARNDPDQHKDRGIAESRFYLPLLTRRHGRIHQMLMHLLYLGPGGFTLA